MQRVINDGIKAMAKCCPLLNQLDIYGSTKTTDISIIALLQHCPLLEVVCLQLFNLTSDSFIELGKLKHITS